MRDIPSRLCYEHDVRLSVCLSVCVSVTLEDCDHIAQQKVEMCTSQDRSVTWKPTLIVILSDHEF